MKSHMSFILPVLFSVVVFTSCDSQKSSTPDVQALKAQDSEDFDALRQLHRQMDDDRSGSIDLSESIGFLQHEMQITNDAGAKQRAFHHQDSQITIDDLWERWAQSAERKWSEADVIEWLNSAVELPQYAAAFEKQHVDGKSMPKLAIANTSLLVGQLGVQNAVHRQKITLKAMEVVLFGYKGKTSYLKDIILISLLTLATAALYFAAMRKKAAERELREMSDKMKSLKDIEEQFKKISVDDKGTANLKMQLADNQTELDHARKQLDGRTTQLQPLLVITYKREVSRLEAKKMEGFRELADAKQMVEKMSKKGASIVSPFRHITGTAEELDGVISRVKNRIETSAKEILECQERWTAIETLCGFSIAGMPGKGLPRQGSGGTVLPPLPIDEVEELPPEKRALYHPSHEVRLLSRPTNVDVSYPPLTLQRRSDQTPVFDLEDVQLQRSGSDGNLLGQTNGDVVQRTKPSLGDVGKSASAGSMELGESASLTGSSSRSDKPKKKGLLGRFKKDKEKKAK